MTFEITFDYISSNLCKKILIKFFVCNSCNKAFFENEFDTEKNCFSFAKDTEAKWDRYPHNISNEKFVCKKCKGEYEILS